MAEIGYPRVARPPRGATDRAVPQAAISQVQMFRERDPLFGLAASDKLGKCFVMATEGHHHDPNLGYSSQELASHHGITNRL